MLLKSKEKVSFAIDTRAITTLRWACFDKFRFAHEGVSTASTIPAPLPAVPPARCLARETGGLRLRKLSFLSAGVQPSSPNQQCVCASFQPRCKRYGPCAGWHGRLAACGCGRSRLGLQQKLFIRACFWRNTTFYRPIFLLTHLNMTLRSSRHFPIIRRGPLMRDSYPHRLR